MDLGRGGFLVYGGAAAFAHCNAKCSRLDLNDCLVRISGPVVYALLRVVIIAAFQLVFETAALLLSYSVHRDGETGSWLRKVRK